MPNRRELIAMAASLAAQAPLTAMAQPGRPPVRRPPVFQHPSPVLTTGRCAYPGSRYTRAPILDMINGIVANRSNAASMYLDTIENMSSEEDDHHQGIARTHKLSDGSIYFFLTHSETDSGDQGKIGTYRYGDPTVGERIVSAHPLHVAPQRQILYVHEQHPCDMQFLRDVGGVDAGYLFVAEENTSKTLAVYRWAPDTNLVLIGEFPRFREDRGPNFVFIDLVDGLYYLGVANPHWGEVRLFTAEPQALFPGCARGSLDMRAFVSAGTYTFPIKSADYVPAQMKLVRDSTGAWYLLGFAADYTDDDEKDYIDVYPVQFKDGFHIGARMAHVHIYLPSGDTGFASSGNCYVDPQGRLLVYSSYRWAEDQGPGNSDYVSRVDEVSSG